jgi:hypothetical protein
MGRFISKRYSRMKSTVIPDLLLQTVHESDHLAIRSLEGALRCRVDKSLEP